MEALYLVCGARRPQLKRNPLGVTGGYLVRSALVAIALLVCATPLRAQALPAFIGRGFDKLLAGRPDSAVYEWTWAWDTTEAAKREQLVTGFRQVVSYAGKVVGYDTIRIVELTPNLRRAYFLLRCQTQPVYLMLVLYRATDRWVVTSVNLHTNADNVLPPTLVSPEQPKPKP
jgi:hypothetical protein